MIGKTISEKILSSKSGQDARAGDVVVCQVDCALGNDASVPMTIDYFESIGASEVRDPERIVFALDHYAPPPNRDTTRLHQRLSDFAARHSISVYGVGEGIGHQIVVESGRVLPGYLAVGADSHAVTYGALNAFATGIGSSDLAAILATGKIWLRVPESIQVTLTGKLSIGVYAKDIALFLAHMLGAGGATYQALEFSGAGVNTLQLEDRFVISNLSVEMGAKAGIFPTDEKTFAYLEGRTTKPLAAVEADTTANYSREIVLDLGKVTPQVALPHQVDNVVSVDDVSRTSVGMVYLGTCTGGRVSDFHQARDILRAGGGVAPGVQLVVTPASRAVFQTLIQDGTMAEFIGWGAVIVTPGCGSCCGTCGAIPGDGVSVISTANRNFKGRMGNSNALIYLASPASCAAAAVRGEIADPREFQPKETDNERSSH